MTHTILLVLGALVLGYLIGALAQRRADVAEEQRLTENFYEAQRLMHEAEQRADGWRRNHHEMAAVAGMLARQRDERLAERDTCERLLWAVRDEHVNQRLHVRSPAIDNIIKHFQL